MIDRNNLNRIKGILSAKTCAEIPKYNPGGTFNINDADFKQWCTQLNIRPNPNTWKQYQHAKNSVPNGSIDQVIEFTKTNGASLPIENANMAIPGDPNITPTTAIENSAELATEIEAQKQKIEAQQAVTQQVVPSNITQTQPSSMISGNNTAPLNTINTAGLNIDPSINEKKVKDIKQANIAQTVGQIGTAAFQGIGDAIGATQQATDSNLTKGADTVYNGVASGLQQAGGVAGIVGTALQMGSTAGNIIQELGGGTDQQTKIDKWMDSSFFSWNIGMLNGFAGKNTQNFGADQDILSTVGSSYGGTTNDILDASEKAGKKYGLFSSKARKKADAAINKARSQQTLMGSIADTATDQRLAAQSMGEQAGLAYSMMTDEGYNQKHTYAAKHGGILEWNPVIEWEPQIELNWELPAFKEGGNIDIVEELEWIPELQSGNKIRTIEELIEYAKKQNPRFIQRLSEEPRGIKFVDDEGNEAEGSHYLEWSTDDSGNAIIYPRIQEIEDGSLKFFPSNEAYKRAINNKNTLIMSPEEAEIFFAKDPEYTTAYKKGWPAFFEKFKKGGSLGDSGIPEIEETTQKNVIPEGALHKNKHHMEHAEGLTKKGIPVIDDDGEQQAEIEHSEIIFTLEVTKKLEEYYEIFYSEESSNKEKEQAALDAGKLLVYQILENTEDRTGLIESCKKGGSLTLKKNTDDLIEEVLEDTSTMIVIAEEPVKNKKVSDKELIKEAIKEALIELLIK